ncbi:hypothetical protein C4Y91_000010 [Klebsiella pneumoniae subsp. pneumoniae]|uniref:hypothetical protein n=1 Tax=Klebsiella pneumoniae TaxID=573 RepID=UPI00098388E0|nr:hypothetical protein [Klebsiella pneumoniae]ELC3569608.1 hypothetical protein [Klebsiella pneumoniae]MBD7347630.1 hypothetical protein [Klebsiella pneumoniae]MBD7358359.1 hypothetical protein [Klebsiella pneumoniae]MBD7374487.1 hypothetical protein [Klebsiella pneumoniae]RNN30726.1 hypothetical protein BL112_00021205 [Klebsiella pneumoniae]
MNKTKGCLIANFATVPQGDTKRIDIVKQASPVAWHNINLKGTYHFELSEKLPDLEELMRSIEGYLPVSEK